MKKTLAFTLLFINCSPLVYALQGQITVLEAPLFLEPNEQSRILQYRRKGDDLYIHEQEAFKDEFEEYNIDESNDIRPSENQDPFIGSKDLYFPVLDGKFYKTLTSNKQEAYVLKEHVFLIFKDKRELRQKLIEHDHTDYRINEPLPKNYPFITSEGYRGITHFTFGVPNYSQYQYPDKIIDTEYSLLKEFNFIWSKAEDVDFRKRFFFGLMTGIHHSSISFLTSNYTAQQDNLRFYIGPLASYDIYRTKTRALNFYISTQAFLLDRMTITAENSTTGSNETRVYQSDFGVSQILGANYQFYKAVHEFDFVVGSAARLNLPKTYTATSNGEQSEFWSSLNSNDSYSQGFRAELSLYFGFQSSY